MPTITIGSVTTSASGGSASVTNSGTPQMMVLDFTLPRGSDGAAGSSGSNGTNGSNGSQGIQGVMGSAGTNGTNGTNASLKGYEGIVLRSSIFPIFKSATVASGAAVFNLTVDGLSTGTALFPNGVITDSVNVIVSDATASYQMSWAFSNSNKTITVTANKLTTANILTGLLGQAQANGAVIKLAVLCY